MRLNGETTLFEVVRSRMLKNTLEKVRLKRVSVQISSAERRKSRKKDERVGFKFFAKILIF